MSIAEKLTTIAENVPKVYNSGYEKGKSEGGGGETEDVWDYIQDYGNRVNYSRAFCYTAFEILNPKYGFENMTNASNMCEYSLLEEIVIYNEKTTAWTNAFRECTNLTKVSGLIKFPYGASVSNMFSGATKLKEAGTLDLSDVNPASTTVASMFPRNAGLEEVHFTGTIPCSISFSTSSKLSYESIMGVINALADYSEDTSGTTFKLTLGATNLAKLSTNDIQIIEDKGWTYA